MAANTQEHKQQSMPLDVTLLRAGPYRGQRLKLMGLQVDNVLDGASEVQGSVCTTPTTCTRPPHIHITTKHAHHHQACISPPSMHITTAKHAHHNQAHIPTKHAHHYLTRTTESQASTQ